jgi:exopolysaccharide production protein ExoQ
MTDVQAAPRRDALSGRAATLAVAAFVLAPVGLIDPLALAPVFAIVAVALLVVARDGLWTAARPLAPAGLLLLLLAAWATISASWSILPQHSLLEGLRLGAIAAGGLVVLASSMALDPQERRWVAAASAIGLGIAAVLLLAEDLSAGALARLVLRQDVALWHYHRGATVLVMALWPVLVASSGPLYRRILLAAVAGAAVLDLGSGTAALALVAGSAVFAVARWTPRIAAAGLVIALVAFAVAAPLAIPSSESLVAMRAETPWIKWSGIHRLLIWRFTSDRIADRPLLGWGMDAAREVPGGKTRLAQRFPDAGLPDDAEALPLHPHDAVLQWELELGMPGTLLCLALAIWGLWRVGFAAPLTRLARAGALGWAGSALVIALLAYGAWQAWWLAALFLAAATFNAAAGIPAGNAGIPARDRP